MRRAARSLGGAVLVAAGAALVGACQPSPQPGPLWGRAPAWLTCADEPVRYLADLVTAAGQHPDSILPFLDSSLQRGPGWRTMLDYEQRLRRIHHRDSVLLRERHALTIRPASEFVADYLRRLEMMWRVRSALALGRILFVYGGPGSVDDSARAILLRASQTIANAAVLAAIHRSLDTSNTRDSLPH